MSAIEEHLEKLGHRLPAAPEAVGFYVPVLRTGQLVITSGQLPMMGKELAFKGKVGRDIHEEEAGHAARMCLLNALAQVKAFLGSLDQVQRVVRVEGFVQCTDDFHSQPAVLNAASELLVDLFGEHGKHTRAAIGTNALPLNAAVELSLWVEAKE